MSEAVTILLFGAEARAVGRSSVCVTLGPGATCEEIKTRLSAEVVPLRPYLNAARFAVNSEFVPLSRVVQAGDEVALIGMVSGG